MLLIPTKAAEAHHHLDPPKLTVTTDQNSLTMRWDDAGGEAYWAVIRDVATGDTVWAREFKSYGRTATVNLDPGDYEAKVRGLGQPGVRDGATAGPWSNTIVATVGQQKCSKPATPVVTATPDGDRLYITWTYEDTPGDPVGQFGYFSDQPDSVMRVTGPDKRSGILKWDPKLDTTVSVVAAKECAVGDAGTDFVEATDKPEIPDLPDMPEGLDVTRAGSGGALITWDRPSSGGEADHFALAVSVNAGPWVPHTTSETSLAIYPSTHVKLVQVYVAGENERGQGPAAYHSEWLG